jgi:hypothetical protein
MLDKQTSEDKSKMLDQKTSLISNENKNSRKRISLLNQLYKEKPICLLKKIGIQSYKYSRIKPKKTIKFLDDFRSLNNLKKSSIELTKKHFSKTNTPNKILFKLYKLDQMIVSDTDFRNKIREMFLDQTTN